MANEYPLIDAAQVTGQEYSVIIRNMIQEENPLLDYMAMVPVPIGNNSIGWFEETSQGTAATRAINGSWTANYARFIPKNAGLTIFGGELKWDRQIPLLYGDRMPNFLQYQAEAKARATYRAVEAMILEGDVGVDPNGFDGFRILAAERGMEFKVSTGTDRDELTLAKLDEVIMAVVGSPVIVLSQWNLRKVNALMRAAGQARENVDGGFGRMFQTYAGYPMIVQERRNDMTTMLGFDEDPGDGGDDASSIYVFNPIGPEEDQGVHCIIGAGSSFEAYGLGEDWTNPQEKSRLEATVGLVVKGNRGLARLKGLGQI